MSLRQASFTTIASRLRTATELFEQWAAIADNLADAEPPGKPQIFVKGVRRPVEETVLGRESAGFAVLDHARVHGIQAVLRAEAASAQVQEFARRTDAD